MIKMVSLINQLNDKPFYCKATGEQLHKVIAGNIVNHTHRDGSMCICKPVVVTGAQTIRQSTQHGLAA